MSENFPKSMFPSLMLNISLALRDFFIFKVCLFLIFNLRGCNDNTCNRTFLKFISKRDNVSMDRRISY